MKMQYGFDDKVPTGKTVPWTLQCMSTIFTSSMTDSIMLASGAGMDPADTAFLIQCGLSACCTITLIQSLGVRIGRSQIGARLSLVFAGSWTFITSMVLFTNDPSIGIPGASGAVCLGTLLLFLLGPIVIDKLYEYFTPAVTGSVVLAVGMCLILNVWDDMVDYNSTRPDAMKMFLIGIAIAAICVIIDHFTKGIVQSLAVLIVMMAGYVFRSVTGIVDFSQVGSAAWVTIPRPLNFGMTVNLGAVITVFIIHIATIMENSGNITGVVTATDEDLPTEETLKTSVRGDALDGVLSILFNALPMCMAAQNSGVEVMSGVASRFATAIAGVILGLMAIFPKFSQVLALTPNSVLGDILLVTFGNVIVGGIKVIGFDGNNRRNFTIIALAATVGIGGNFAQATGTLAFLPSAVVTLFTGISGTAITALVLNIIPPDEREEEAQRQNITDREVRVELVALNVNGRTYNIAVEKNRTLLYTLWEVMDLTGTKYGCSTGDRGSCKVIIDGEAVDPCSVRAMDMGGKAIETIEGISPGHVSLHLIQQAFIDYGAVQCGFCTPGMVMAARALLDKNPDPAEEEIKEAIKGDLRRCTGYVKILEAVKRAAQVTRKGGR